MARRIVMLGTGHATVTKCYNTCFLIDNEGRTLLVDAGGGNGILTQFERIGRGFSDVHDIFVTHAHTDHLLGVVWVIRKALSLMTDGAYVGRLNIYCDEKSAELLKMICRETLFSGYMRLFEENVRFIDINDRTKLCCAGMDIKVFDVYSDKLLQLGFKAVFDDGFTLVCTGDEPVNEHSAAYVRGCDMLMCEAYCLAADAERFHPYRKRHSTAADAAAMAERLGVKRLLLYHAEDTDLKNRSEKYSREAAGHFSGSIIVPNDLDIIDF